MPMYRTHWPQANRYKPVTTCKGPNAHAPSSPCKIDGYCTVPSPAQLEPLSRPDTAHTRRHGRCVAELVIHPSKMTVAARFPVRPFSSIINNNKNNSNTKPVEQKSPLVTVQIVASALPACLLIFVVASLVETKDLPITATVY